MRCVSSFFLTAFPSPFDAEIVSAASFSAIDFSLRSRENEISQRTALGADFDGDLVGRTADAAALHLDDRLEVRERLLEDVDAGLRGAGLDEVHRMDEANRIRRLPVSSRTSAHVLTLSCEPRRA